LSLCSQDLAWFLASRSCSECMHAWLKKGFQDCALDLQHHKWTRGGDRESSTQEIWELGNEDSFLLWKNKSQPRNKVPES
jgi:hypothetical protein